MADFIADLLLVDLSHIARTLWHASENQEIGEAFSRTVEIVNRLAPKYAMTALLADAPPYKRKQVAESYKANREAFTPMYFEQLRKMKERLKADGFLIFEVAGYEADDLAATCVGYARREEPPLSVMLASADKDWAQLVSDAFRVRVLHPFKGDVLDEGAVREKMGVPPRLVADALALQGDKSDGIAGVKGCGPVNAAKLLERFGDLEGVLQGYRTIEQPAMRANIEAGADAARLARKLVTLYDDVPIDFEAVYTKRERQPLVKTDSDVVDAEFDEVEDDLGDLLSAPPEKANGQPAAVPEGNESGKTPGVARDRIRGLENDATETLPKLGSSQVKAEVVTGGERPAQPTALALAPVEYSVQLEPRNGKEAIGLSEKLFNSRLFGQYGTPEAVLAIILRGRSLGIDSVTALANFHVVEGKPVMHAALIVGLVLRSGKAEFFELVESSDEGATWETHRIGNRKPTRKTFTIRDACNAGLVTHHSGEFRGVSKSGRPSNWDKYRSTMLEWRAAVQLARVVYPDIVTGLYTADEISDGQEV